MSSDETKDKTSPQKKNVRHQTITFRNRYGITLAADLYLPARSEGRTAALAVSGPLGQVGRQAFCRYAHTMAERSFITLAFDPSCTEENKPHHPDVSALTSENVSAAVAYLTARSDVDETRISICGFGGQDSSSENTKEETSLHDGLCLSSGESSDATAMPAHISLSSCSNCPCETLFAGKLSLSADEEKLAKDFCAYMKSRQ